ncbi:ZZ-type zinc finger-containing protein 3 [Halocaridina rubra]|uniref:ZZ-type zinc finger-containing protein 3 n=1 Tax=Halocaridina rubra TaxID=373956 RepID=A0AAN9A4P7_HALRR
MVMSIPEATDIDELQPVFMDDEEDTSEYYFESDPLALKGNADYQSLLKALVKLVAQRSKAIKDLERLQEARDEALTNPLSFVTALQNGENLNLPAPQEIVQIPDIDWEKYNVQSIMQGARPKTRKHTHQEMQQTALEQIGQDIKDSKEAVSLGGKILVRGRIYDESKPQTFNQSWTEEEQRKLEELLIKYPDEEISYHRWAKIARELGTRTTIQVQSRVQKYFIALKQQGLPVPGKNPRTALLKKTYRAKKRGNSAFGRTGKSVFMKAFNMCKDKSEEVDLQSASPSETSIDISDEEDIVEDLKNSEEYRELLKLKHVKALKEQEIDSGVIAHPGFACDNCGVDPIIGPRWHCLECPASVSIDLCEICVKTNFSTDTHRAEHVLQPVKALCIKDTMLSQI